MYIHAERNPTVRRDGVHATRDVLSPSSGFTLPDRDARKGSTIAAASEFHVRTSAFSPAESSYRSTGRCTFFESDLSSERVVNALLGRARCMHPHTSKTSTRACDSERESTKISVAGRRPTSWPPLFSAVVSASPPLLAYRPPPLPLLPSP